MKKYSILGLSLLAVSAIAAAFAPSKDANGNLAINGHHTLSTGQPASSGDFTCREALTGDAKNCSFTDTGNNNLNAGVSSTSGAGVSDSITFTQGNATDSLTTAINVD